jgi:NAD-dependent deacetylase
MDAVEQARAWLNAASRVAVLTGAGISAESGIPTFRGGGGLWRQYRAQDLATPEAFARDPRVVWEWYDWRRSLIAKAQPNPGHISLAELESKKPCFTLITQNVDGLHDRAGSRNVLKVHGDIWTLRCLACGRERIDHRTPLPELPPKCECGRLLRPGVVWFGEPLPADVWRNAEQAACSAEVCLVVGTSVVVYPAAGLVRQAKSSGARVIEVNLEKTEISSQVDCSLYGKSGELLPQLVG